MSKTKAILIKNARLINEGNISKADVWIEGAYIKKIASTIALPHSDVQIVDAQNKYLIPGLIDDQVHFREPGLTHKATIATESKAALSGGITSYIEMPNTNPQTTTLAAFQDKLDCAALTSHANYGFMFGGTNDNLETIKKLDPKKVAALKLFLGSSTGNMLVDNPEVLEAIFSNTDLLIAVHCEDEETIKNNTQKYLDQYGENIPIACHPEIRSVEACYLSSSRAIALAKKTNARLHVFHLSTAAEMTLFRNDIPLEEKRITAEVCVHHLWFSEEDYAEKGTHIKWNPAVKSSADRAALWQALNDDRLDVIATDHAPHTKAEKQNSYTKAPSGGPLVQHALPALLEASNHGKITLEKIVEKACHNPAILFQIEKRGFIREGYFADLVLVDPNAPWTVKADNLHYKCGWSPFEGTNFKNRVTHTILNGVLVYAEGQFTNQMAAMPLTFDR